MNEKIVNARKRKEKLQELFQRGLYFGYIHNALAIRPSHPERLFWLYIGANFDNNLERLEKLPPECYELFYRIGSLIELEEMDPDPFLHYLANERLAIQSEWDKCYFSNLYEQS